MNKVVPGGEISCDEVPEWPLRLAHNIARTLRIDHAGFDLAEVDGHWYVLEFNVFFGNEALTMAGVRIGPVVLDFLRCQSGTPRDPGRPLWPVAC